MPDYYRLTLESDTPPPADPLEAKREYARRLVERWHGAEAAEAAAAAFDRQFKQGRAAEDARRLALPAEDPVHVPAFLLSNGLARSSSDARRLIQQGGVRLDGERLGEDELDVPRGRLAGAELRVGRRFCFIEPA
jgi:tyrosyl-tRNA synthetase